jgi:hypothetical protein
MPCATSLTVGSEHWLNGFAIAAQLGNPVTPIPATPGDIAARESQLDAAVSGAITPVISHDGFMRKLESWKMRERSHSFVSVGACARCCAVLCSADDGC